MVDKKIIFFNRLKKLEGSRDYLEYYLKYQLAPVIMGFKPAMTLNVGERNGGSAYRAYPAIIEEMGLRCCTLRKGRNTDILFIYKPCLIEELLRQKKVTTFLKTFGYPIQSVEEAVDFLRQRYAVQHCPHELGIFLGFPIEDVCVYMENPHKVCRLCGYWKVYHDIEGAKRTFAAYDKAKENMICLLLQELEHTA